MHGCAFETRSKAKMDAHVQTKHSGQFWCAVCKTIVDKDHSHEETEAKREPPAEIKETPLVLPPPLTPASPVTPTSTVSVEEETKAESEDDNDDGHQERCGNCSTVIVDDVRAFSLLDEKGHIAFSCYLCKSCRTSMCYRDVFQERTCEVCGKERSQWQLVWGKSDAVAMSTTLLNDNDDQMTLVDWEAKQSCSGVSDLIAFVCNKCLV